MVEHAFGGAWTQIKLDRLNRYLTAYRTIFTGNPKARYFRTWYVDAFAGTGSRSNPKPSKRPRPRAVSLFGEDVYDDDDAIAQATEYLDGSAKIALGLASPFDNYLFIEKSRARVQELKRVIGAEFPELVSRCYFRMGDANEELRGWCSERDWKKDRAVVFLDPYGMQVEWTTIEALAATQGVDLWYLFPGIARLLRHDGDIDEGWQKRLDTLLGTTTWRQRFFEKKEMQGLFGMFEMTQRNATENAIKEFIHERLATCFGKKVAKGMILRNTKNSPLYFLCFAASNERGAGPALKIANHILDD